MYSGSNPLGTSRRRLFLLAEAARLVSPAAPTSSVLAALRYCSSALALVLGVCFAVGVLDLVPCADEHGAVITNAEANGTPEHDAPGGLDVDCLCHLVYVPGTALPATPAAPPPGRVAYGPHHAQATDRALTVEVPPPVR